MVADSFGKMVVRDSNTSYGSRAAPSEPQKGVVANLANSFVFVLLGTCVQFLKMS